MSKNPIGRILVGAYYTIITIRNPKIVLVIVGALIVAYIMLLRFGRYEGFMWGEVFWRSLGEESFDFARGVQWRSGKALRFRMPGHRILQYHHCLGRAVAAKSASTKGLTVSIGFKMCCRSPSRGHSCLLQYPLQVQFKPRKPCFLLSGWNPSAAHDWPLHKRGRSGKGE